jgi:hypothetical protein
VAAVCFAGTYLVSGAHGLGLLGRLGYAAALLALGLGALVWSAAMAHVGVRISAYNVNVRHGLLPMTVMTVPLRSVRGARVVDVAPTVWRRWGWTWVPGRGRSVIVRSGPALALELGSGRRLVVSVDEPEQAVLALQQLGAAAG